MSKDSHRRYLERKGFRKPKDNSLSRSEEGVRYQYDDRIWNKFTKWSTKQRDAGIVPMFKDFYNELTPENKEQIKLPKPVTAKLPPKQTKPVHNGKLPAMNKRLENIKFLQKVAAGKITSEDVIKQPGWRIWLNLTGLTREQYIQDCIDKGIPPPSANPRYKITLNLNKT